SDIETISVLKDAPATALYGSRAANGVILVNTRQGRSGTSGLDLKMSYGITTRAVADYETVSPAQYYELQWEGLKNLFLGQASSVSDAARSASDKLVDMLGGYNAFNVPDNQLIGSDGGLNPNARMLWQDNWKDELINSGNRKEITLNAHGGSEKSKYFL